MYNKNFLQSLLFVFRIIIFLFFIKAESAAIKILFTAAIIEDPNGSRQACYIRNLQYLKRYGCDVYVVESCQQGPTYLDQYCDHVCYTKSNNKNETKSNNEVNSMLIGMKYFNFDIDDMIIKVTGRYVLEDDQFISLVKNNLEADIIARIWNEKDAYTGYFAIKMKHLINMLNHYYDVYNTKNKYYAVEHALGDYITLNKNHLYVIPIPKLYNYPMAGQKR